MVADRAEDPGIHAEHLVGVLNRQRVVGDTQHCATFLGELVEQFEQLWEFSLSSAPLGSSASSTVRVPAGDPGEFVSHTEVIRMSLAGSDVLTPVSRQA